MQELNATATGRKIQGIMNALDDVEQVLITFSIISLIT
jgi:hypothetical protein